MQLVSCHFGQECDKEILICQAQNVASKSQFPVPDCRTAKPQNRRNAEVPYWPAGPSRPQNKERHMCVPHKELPEQMAMALVLDTASLPHPGATSRNQALAMGRATPLDESGARNQ